MFHLSLEVEEASMEHFILFHETNHKKGIMTL